ncbi:unnamed protein product [Tetraodon nigroviridis]|uniref:(spotted green pufferfish) hypothetical protein n=1 Tax=Tetraodon nigroviridis TaxID=99883 RepID=Q4TH60_TETNG|nr:unnamed protein product [Tetraodon nigroviridis]
MIPGPHCAAVPFQVYLLAGIARWNADRESGSVMGQQGRKHLVYVSPLVQRLNERKSIQLTDCAVADEFDPCAEDVCGPNHLPGYEHVEELSKILVDIALEEGKLAISSFTRQSLIAAWNKLHLHDRSIQQFDSLYAARWGNTLFGRTNGDPSESSLVQKLKFSKRYSAAHLLDSRKNRLMYCVVKQLWLHPDCTTKG